MEQYLYLKKREKEDKGFTLVELIIVVAIIAVLAAVLAPQYLRYVERSRQSNDLQVATSIMRAATVAVSDPMVGAPSSQTYTITWDTSADDVTFTVADSAGNTDGVAQEIRDSIAEVMGWVNVAGEFNGAAVNDAGSEAGNAQSFVFTLNVSTGNITISQTDSNRWQDEIGVEA